MAWGRGLTVCGFCGKRLAFAVTGNAVSIDGRDGLFSALMPLYCSRACESAKVSHLFDEVLR